MFKDVKSSTYLATMAFCTGASRCAVNSPMKGLDRMLGVKSIIEFTKNLLKLSLVTAACLWVFWPYRNMFVALPNMQKSEMLCIKNPDQSYTAEFIELLKPYYLIFD